MLNKVSRYLSIALVLAICVLVFKLNSTQGKLDNATSNLANAGQKISDLNDSVALLKREKSASEEAIKNFNLAEKLNQEQADERREAIDEAKMQDGYADPDSLVLPSIASAFTYDKLRQ